MICGPCLFLLHVHPSYTKSSKPRNPTKDSDVKELASHLWQQTASCPRPDKQRGTESQNNTCQNPTQVHTVDVTVMNCVPAALKKVIVDGRKKVVRRRHSRDFTRSRSHHAKTDIGWPKHVTKEGRYTTKSTTITGCQYPGDHPKSPMRARPHDD